MSRSLSATFQEAVYAATTSEVFLVLLTLEHDDLDSGETIRLVNNTKDITSNGDTYTAFPFNLTLPSDHEDRPPEAEISIDNIDRTIIQKLRDFTSEADVTLEIVLASDPDTIEVSFSNMKLQDMTYNAEVITGRLVVTQLHNEPYPGDRMGPNDFPGLF